MTGLKQIKLFIALDYFYDTILLGGDKMIKRISADPKICGGYACIKGTRVPVYVILDFLAAGDSIEKILTEYPQLSRDDVLAAIEYASLLAKEELELVEA